MTKIMIVIVLLNLLMVCSSCKKDIINNPDPNYCQDITCDTSKLMGKLDTLWSVYIREDKRNISNEAIHMLEDNVLVVGYSNTQGFVNAFFKDNGHKEWEWDSKNMRDFPSSYLHNGRSEMVLHNRRDIVVLDVTKGQIKKAYHQVEGLTANPYGHLIGDNYYYVRSELNYTKVFLIRSSLDDLTFWEEIYSLSQEDAGVGRPNIQSYNLWLHPDTHDSILIFQHRMSSPNRVDVVAWNMTHQRIEWIHEDLTRDGNSNHQQIFLHDNKAYFGGSLTYYCFDMFTGNILWSYDHPDQTTSFSILKTIYAESVDAIIVKAVSLFAFDPITGAIKWINHNAGISSGSSASPVYHDEVIYYTADSKLWAVRARNGVVLWSESSARIPMGESTFRGAVTIDPDRRVLYATSRDRLFAIRLYED